MRRDSVGTGDNLSYGTCGKIKVMTPVLSAAPGVFPNHCTVGKLGGLDRHLQ